MPQTTLEFTLFIDLTWLFVGGAEVGVVLLGRRDVGATKWVGLELHNSMCNHR